VRHCCAVAGALEMVKEARNESKGLNTKWYNETAMEAAVKAERDAHLACHGINGIDCKPPTEPPQFSLTKAQLNGEIVDEQQRWKECGCGTTGCTEHLAQEERCPRCQATVKEIRGHACILKGQHHWHSQPKKPADD